MRILKSGDGTSWLAWSLALLYMILLAFTMLFVGLAQPILSPEQAAGSVSLQAILVTQSAYSLVGALIASRRPKHPIGWILLAIGVCGVAEWFGEGYAVYALLVRPGSLPWGEAGAWLFFFTRNLPISLGGTFLLLLFPTGALPSPSWRPVAWVSGVFIIARAFVDALTPASLDGFPSIQNPLGLQIAQDTFVAAQLALNAVWLGLSAVCAFSVLLRLRNATGLERQQLKWFAYATVFLLAAFLSGTFQDLHPVISAINLVLPVVGAPAIPIAIGVAVLRYRLYEIDRVINRTLVYVILTLGLGLLYWVGVLVLQIVLRPVTQGSDIATVIGTLLVATVFQPVRRRVQALVDLRFYRPKYDAQRTLEAFSTRLRDQVDLHDLSADILSVIHRTVQPSHAWLWLRTNSAPEQDQSR